MELALKTNEQIERLAPIFTYAKNCLYLGRGYNYPVALEGALKLKEISYIHAEGYPAAEMKHGPIALIDSEMPVFVIATRDKLYEKSSATFRRFAHAADVSRPSSLQVMSKSASLQIMSSSCLTRSNASSPSSPASPCSSWHTTSPSARERTLTAPAILPRVLR